MSQTNQLAKKRQPRHNETLAIGVLPKTREVFMDVQDVRIKLLPDEARALAGGLMEKAAKAEAVQTIDIDAGENL